MRYVLTSSHSFNSAAEPDPFLTAAAAWQWAALDLASSDHGADDAAQLADAEIMAAHATDTPERWQSFVSHDGIAFCVTPELTCEDERRAARLLSQRRALARAIADQAQAIADRTVIGPEHAQVARLLHNAETLAAWTPDGRS